MPLSNIIYPNANSKIVCWNIEETREELEFGLAMDDNFLKKLDSCAKHRQLELLAVRNVLKVLGGKYVKLGYDEFRKPYLLESEGHISISHSKKKVAVFYHKDKQVGLDLEHISPKLMRVREKFCHEKETAFCQENLTYLCLVWSAKESLYKFYGKKELEFKEEMLIEKFQLSQKGHFWGNVQKGDFKARLNIDYIIFGEYLLTFCSE